MYFDPRIGLTHVHSISRRPTAADAVLDAWQPPLETDAMIMGHIMAHLRDAAGEAFIEASPEQPSAENTAIRLVRFSRRAAKPMATAGYDPAPTA